MFSEELLDGWNGMHLISVDPWRAAAGELYQDKANVSQDAHDRLYEETVRRLARFGARSSVWRATSGEAAERIPDHSLDFVYIDARHDYESVKEDLGVWFPKIRPGGVLAGHDYIDVTTHTGVYGVKSAVDEFFGARGLSVSSTFHDVDESWIVAKPTPGAEVSELAWTLGTALRDCLAVLRRLRVSLDRGKREV